MTAIEDHQRLLSGPLKYTTARWYNDFSEGVQGPGGEWIVKPPKKPAFRGKYTQFRYGHDHPSTWAIRHLQRCLVCCFNSGTIGVDVDHPELFATTRTARLVGRAQAISTRGGGYHVLLDCRWLTLVGERRAWPRQVPIAGADIKSAGFIPVPGCVHYSGQLYQPVPGAMAVPGTHELLGAILADQEDEKARSKAEMDEFLARNGLPPMPAGFGGGGGNGHDGKVAAACMGMILRRLRAGWQVSPELKEAVYAEWCGIAIPHKPEYPFERKHFERHYGDERRGGLEAALAIIAAEAAWMPGAMAWAEEINRSAREPVIARQARQREGRTR